MVIEGIHQKPETQTLNTNLNLAGTDDDNADNNAGGIAIALLYIV
jgi:hypothetical protein